VIMKALTVTSPIVTVTSPIVTVTSPVVTVTSPIVTATLGGRRNYSLDSGDSSAGLLIE